MKLAATACLLACSFSAAMPARARDAGPAKDVRAVRSIAGTLLPGVHIDNVVAGSGMAMTQWSGPKGSGIDGFAYIWDRWWDLLQIRPGAQGTCISGSAPFARGMRAARSVLGVDDLTAAGVPPALAAAAAANFDGIATGQAQFAQSSPGRACEQIQSPSPRAGELDSRPWESEGYSIHVSLARQTGTFTSLQVTGRRPTQAESWTYFPGGNAYAYFHLDTEAAQAVEVASGTTVDLWCPFVLDPSKTYSLTIAKAQTPIGPITGKLNDNTLHFELPAFTVPANTELMAEVDGSL